MRKLSVNAERLVKKLANAGLTEDQAREWIIEILDEDWKFEVGTVYDENGDMNAARGQKFRQVGWQVIGGSSGGMLVGKDEKEVFNQIKSFPHGGFSPVYIEVSND